MLSVCAVALTLNSACKQDLVHQRPMAELNMKAQQMMQAGDYEGAVARLESAHDLDPTETKTMHNLAVAYQMKGDYDKSIATFEKLLKEPGIDQSGVLKSLGVTYEAKADLLMGEAGKIEDKTMEGKALTPEDKAAMETHTKEATGYYQMALDFYEKALPGLKQKADVEAQIKALEEKLSKLSEPSQQG